MPGLGRPIYQSGTRKIAPGYLKTKATEASKIRQDTFEFSVNYVYAAPGGYLMRSSGAPGKAESDVRSLPAQRALRAFVLVKFFFLGAFLEAHASSVTEGRKKCLAPRHRKEDARLCLALFPCRWFTANNKDRCAFVAAHTGGRES